MSTLLKSDGLWYCVSGRESIADATARARPEEKALSRIILSLDKSNYPHVMQAKTAFEAWTALEKAFEDKGLHRRLRLLRSLCSVKLENFSNMEEYVNEIMALSQQLMSIGKPMDDEFLGVIMLQGLTDEYEPMVMALENSGVEITSDFVKTKLLQDKKWQNGKHSVDSALAMKHKPNKSPWCWNCRQKGHYKNQCQQKPVSGTEKNEKTLRKTKKKFDSQGGHKVLFTALGVNMGSKDWYVDSGASSHMTGNKEILTKLSEKNSGQEIFVANNTKLSVAGTGNSLVKLKPTGDEKEILDVKYVPNLSVNLLSVNSMVSKGYSVYFDADSCKILNNKGCHIKGEPIATATNVDGLYKLDMLNQNEEQVNIAKIQNSQMLWHKRLGHLNHYSMGLLKNGLATGLTYNEEKIPSYCESCIKGKQARKPFPCNKNKGVVKNKLDLIHSDLVGPMEVASWSGSKYMLTFIDDHTRKIFSYFLKSKEEVPAVFQEFCVFVENQTERKIKVLRTDNGGEYCNDQLKKFLKSRGIKHELTVPYTPQQNGVAERYNRSIMEKVRSMLVESNSQKQMWAEAANTAVYLLNRSPTKKVKDATPEEKWTGSKIDLSHLRVFGCRGYVHIPDKIRKKLDEKSKEYIFVGYSETSVGYRLLDPKNHKLKIARDVVFIEDKFDTEKPSQHTVFPSTVPLPEDEVEDQGIPEPEQSLEDSSEPSADNENGNETLESPSEPATNDGESIQGECILSENEENFRRYPRRNVSKPKIYDDYVMNDEFDHSDSAMSVAISNDLEPSNVSEAMLSSRKSEWKTAIKKELDSFKINNAWELVDKPSNRNIVKNKWVFKVKKDQDGNIATYKARLVAKGFTQKIGVDYSETFSPVIRFSNLRLLLAMTAELDLEAEHLDVETAFLNGEIDQTIYMSQPEGFEEPGFENKVCLLKKAIYGLKQSSRLWYEKARNVLSNLGFKQSKIEPCIFYKHSSNSIIVIALYVDDFFIFHNNVTEVTNIKIELDKHFHIKDLGPISYCLGMKIERNRQKCELKISQEQYIMKILDRFHMTECNVVGTPMEQKQILSVSEEYYDSPYQQLIGSLMYLSVCTRPDIAFPVSYLSQFNLNHTKEHWLACKRVLKYLKGTKNMGITFKKCGEPVIGYVDADWANNVSDRKSYYGYIFILANGPISWECQKQKVIALSSTEAEYIGICEATKESVYLRSLCKELFDQYEVSNFLKLDFPMTIYNDNQSALKLSENQVFHKRTKHIHVKYHFIRDKVKNADIELLYMPTNDMVADMLTKPLGVKKHQLICDRLSLE